MIKIGRLRLVNFKSFSDIFDFDFKNKDLVIFDGPNGYGKTSIFDALELLFSKKVTRYKDIDFKIKNTNLFSGSAGKTKIYLELITKSSEDITICVEFEENKFNKIEEIYSNIKYSYNYSWEDAINNYNNKVIADLSEVFSDYSFLKLYNIFNYIQQEETVSFLKLDEKTRHSTISYLFGIYEESENLKKIEKVEDALKNKYTKLQELNDENLSKIQKLLEENLHYDFKNKSKIYFKEDSLSNDYLVEKIEQLNILKIFFKNKDKLNNTIGFYNLKKIVNNNFVDDIFKYHSYSVDAFIDGKRRYNSLSKKILWLNEIKKVKNLTSNRVEFLNYISNSKIKFIKNIYNLNIGLIEDFLNLKNEVDELSLSVDDFKIKRELFLDSFYKNKHKAIDDCSCPVCGQNYESFSQLYSAIGDVEKVISSLHDLGGNRFYQLSNQLQEKVVLKIITRIDYFINRYDLIYDEIINYEFFNYDLMGIIKIQEVVEILNSLGFYFIDNVTKFEYFYFLENLDVYDYENYIKFENILKNLNLNYLENLFVYDGDFILSEFEIENEILAAKQYLIDNNNSIISNLRMDVNKNSNVIDKIKSKKDRVVSLKNKYKEAIKEYERKIVRSIQIPFYIYTSKILQTRSNGSGLFLKLSEDNRTNNFIKFCINKNDDNDAWNRLSSGQLSGLIIALTLSMNKAFPNPFKFLLIDDPIHYMDDINMASFIQLLIYEFNNYQFIFSTHDRRVSSYFSRKYRDFGLKTDIFNLKDIKLKKI